MCMQTPLLLRAYSECTVAAAVPNLHLTRRPLKDDDDEAHWGDNAACEAQEEEEERANWPSPAEEHAAAAAMTTHKWPLPSGGVGPPQPD